MLSLITLSLLITRIISDQKIAYSDSLARQKLIYAAISSYSTDPKPCSSHGFPDATVIRQVTVACDNVSVDDSCSGFVGVSSEEKAILVVFRGTTSDKQLLIEAVETIVENHVS